MFKILGILFMVLAVAIGVVPLFTDCLSQGLTLTLANGATQPMKCHWTALAETGPAVLLLAMGGMMVAARRRESLGYLCILDILSGIMVIAFPAGLIGVCAMPTHTCVTLMEPALLAMGSLVIGLGILGLVWSRRFKEQI
jgi:hypothetical protein